ncbi:MAG: DNA polymerase III subunit gamma/tau, partial [Anaerolineaceae bacterium]|nr:DNA polymerase III subunit gamma/tau [Anaerolineaceae bacterium]
MSQALYRKWRPNSWDEVVGQDHIVQTLHNAVISDRVGHAYLFAGPRGTGKTTSARLLAKAVNCLETDQAQRPCNKCANCESVNHGRYLDLIEIDAASNTSVDDIRDLRDKINFSPSQGKFKVYIIDEVHMLSTSAFNALLKTLEEPPPHVIFILATTEIHKIPATVLSRCQRHEFRRIPIQIIVSKLEELCADEEIKINIDTLTLIARQSTGSLRDAISLIDQLSSMSKHVTLEIAQDMLGTATSQSVIDLVSAVVDKNEAKGLTSIHQALDAGSDPRQFARQIVEYMRSLLLFKMKLPIPKDTPSNVKTTMTEQANLLSTEMLIHSINAFSAAAIDLKANWHPGLGLELAFTEIVTSSNFHLSESSIKVTNVYKESEPITKESKSNKKVLEQTPVKQNTQFITEPKVEPEPKVSSPQSLSNISIEQEQATGINLKKLQQNWKTVKEMVRQT